MSRELLARHGYLLGLFARQSSHHQPHRSVRRPNLRLGYFIGGTHRLGATIEAPPSLWKGLAQLLGFVQVLDVDRQIAERWGAVRAAQLDSGTLTPRVDLLIGATALVHNLTLVTHNVKDYVYVPGLNVVDWLAP